MITRCEAPGHGRCSGGRTEAVVASAAGRIVRNGATVHLNDEEQRQRIIEIVKKKTDLECPELQLVDIQLGFRVWVFYWCHAEEAGDLELLRDIRLSADEAEYIGVDRSAWRAAPPEGL